MSTVEPFVSEADQVEWIEEIKATDKLWVIGDEGGDVYGIGPYVSFYVYHSVEEASKLITHFVEIFNEFNQMKNGFLSNILLKIFLLKRKMPKHY